MPARIVMGPLARAAAAALCVALNVLGACSTETSRGEACYPGDTRDCACPAGVIGRQRCAADGSGYSAVTTADACNCAGDLPYGCVAGAPLACDGSAGKLPFMCPCDSDEQCETGTCFVFNAKGKHCTRSCAVSLDCPSPSCACNNQGVCKVP